MHGYSPMIHGYHCNEDSKITEFKNGNRNLIESIEDDIWLGNGMYFWDNEGNSEYWKRNREKRYYNQTFSIVKVALSLEYMLDLTDTNHIKLCRTIVEDLKSKGVTEFDDKQLGKNINVIFENTELLNTFHLLRVHGLYPEWTEKPFLQSLGMYDSNRPTSNVKTIYCVKNHSAIRRIL